jgi:hypothetical protein
LFIEVLEGGERNARQIRLVLTTKFDFQDKNMDLEDLNSRVRRNNIKNNTNKKY